MAQLNYTATADLKTYSYTSGWALDNIDQNASTWDPVTGEGVIIPVNSSVIFDWNWLLNCPYILTAEVEDGFNIKSFSGCTNLTSVILPNSYTTIYNSMFNNCTGLTSTSITFPSAYTKIEFGAFFGCTSLTSFNIPSSVTNIRPAFKGCTNLTSITVDSNNTYYNDGNGSNCIIETATNKIISGCKTTIIPNSVVSIGECAFNSLPISSIDLKNVVRIEDSGSLPSAGQSAFGNCTSLTNIIFSNSLEYLGKGAFSNCTSLTSVSLPATLITIGQDAFQGCTNLLSVTCKATTPPTLGTNNFTASNDTLKVPSNSVSAYQNDASWSAAFTTITAMPLEIHYTATADLKSYDSWCTSKVDQNASTWDSTTHEGTLVLNRGITSIYSAFRNCSDLISINISGIRTIELFSFSGCTNLVSVTFDNSLVSINQQGNFSGCTSLMNFTLPESLVFLGFESFKNTGWWNSQSNGIVYKDDWCLGYKGSRPTGDITIQNGIKKIISSAFNECNGITSVNFPNTLQYINSKAFYSCSGLTEITIPESLMDLSQQCFGNCPSLKTLYWNANGENMSTVYNSPWYPNTVIENVILGNTVVNIPGGVFGGFPITEIIIPNSVTSIGGGAFLNCSGLTEVTLPESLTAINSTVFSGCTSLTEIVIPDSVTSIGSCAFQNCSGLTEITLPESLTTIGSTSTSSSTFNNCSNLTTIYWNSINITSYTSYSYVFNNAPISNVIFGNSVTNIPNNAFSSCTSLTEINLPESLITIGNNAFANCTSLQKIIIPNLVTTIGNNAFNGCSGLTEVTLSESLTTINQDTFRGCTSLTEIVIPDSVTTIGNNVFYGCTELTEVTLPESLTTINGYAFNNCTSLQKIIIPDSVTSIGQGVFNGCSGLTELTLSDSITNIPMYLTQGCTSLTQIIIPNSVTNISNSAFPSQSLIKVACKATTPPTLGSTNNFIASNDTLYVYPDYISTYHSNSSWRNAFANIAGLYEVTSTVTGSGSVSPSSTTANEGDDVTITITPDEGYGIFSVTDNGTSVPVTHTGMTYTISNIAADHAIAVVFKPYFEINIQVTEGGSLSFPDMAFADEDFTITATPNEGFDVREFVVDGTDLGRSVYSYTFQAVDSNHSVEVVFSPIYNITVESTEGGTIEGPSIALGGDDVTFTITPDEGMLIFNVLDNDVPIAVNPLGMTYTISNIQENHTIEVIFAIAKSYGFDLSNLTDDDYIIQIYEEKKNL